MAKTDPVPLTRSPAEISTLNSLRSLPDFLQYSQRPQSGDPNDRGRNVVTSSVTALRSLCNTQGRCQSVSNTAEPGSLQRWLALAEISAKLDDDVQNLEREIQVHERKRSALERSNLTKLPPAESCELGTKLQCLQEVLGTARFRTYCRDLFMLVRNLRLRLDLYGFRLLAFERHLCRDRLVSVEKLLWLMNETERCLPTPEETNRPESTMAESSPPISREDFALLFQHCSGPETPEAVSSAGEDDGSALRIRTTRGQSKRKGYRPPPDYTRVHHIHAAIKLQRSHCSTAEMEAAEAWLQVVGTEAVTLQDLLQFHLTVSDAHVSEDAQFVRFVQRMWGFDPLAVKDADRGDAIQRLVENYTARCNLLELITRKRELLAKIPGAQARIRSAATLLESELQHLRALQAPAGLSLWLQCDEGINSRLGGTLTLLRELTLSGQMLVSIPDFVGSLKDLQLLDLRDNRLGTIAPALGNMKNLRALNLSDNLLRDASFMGSDDLWSQLEVLTDLRLSGNKLTSLPSALVAIPNLEILDLSRNMVRSIRGEVVNLWKGRSRLVTLDLYANALLTLPEEIHVLFGTLRRLLLHQNQLARLPSTIRELIRLEELTLSQNQLTGESISCYPIPEGHVAISLAQNQLRVLPRLVVVHVEGKGPPKPVNTSVTSVDVRGNRLRNVVTWSPIVLANCQALHLQNNSLRELPAGFFTALPALRVCELQSNQLRMLPVEIAECTQLQTLHVNDNSLQSLPKELVQLPYLETLNAAHNELTEIPSEWHAFETQNDGSRVLHSLMLRRNPLSNKILMSIVDGSTDSSLYSTTTGLNGTTDDTVCEDVIKKLLDGLRDASVILRTDRVPIRKAWDDTDAEDEEGLSNRPKWRGVARDVCHYLEQRLRAMQRPSTGRHSAPLRADVKSFERLIRALPFTCSKRELTHLVRRFIVLDDAEDEEQTKRTRQIDGLAFLQAIERFGRWRSISTPSKRSMNSANAARTGSYRTRSKRSTEASVQEKLRRHKETAKTPGKKNPGVAKQKLSPSRNRASQQPMKPSKARADVLADRQRQRIQVLEQQLVDQKLLLLARQQPNVGRNRSSEDNNDSAIAPADLALVSDKDRRERQTGDGTVTIRVKCPHLREKIGNQQMHTMENNACLDCCLHVQSDESVLHLKHQLEAQTGVPVDHQILVTNSGRRGAPAIRLRNNSKLREYSEHVGGVSRWSLTLLIGQSLPLFSGRQAT
ncbi:Leucine rich repeat [Phytophthora infestans]|uniref:Leucine rich repeat n=1 Tax=Phytophthora infestans TaxID=4787 RepID=A0A833T4C5_PHYIN|nr:Leucine rich repeat [Phytophthora infestans]